MNCKSESKLRYVSPYEIALIYTGLDKKDEALEWLERAYLECSYALIHLKVEPMFDPLRSDARFINLLQRIGFVS